MKRADPVTTVMEAAVVSEKASQVKLSIIIVNYNSGEFLRGCLTSIANERPSFPFEIIVVDNCSTDGSAETISLLFPRIILIKNAINCGFARANNIGILRSVGEYVLLLNPDTIILPGALDRLVAGLEGAPDAGAAGPGILNANRRPQRTGVVFPSLWNVLCEALFLDQLMPSSRLFGRHRQLYRSSDESRYVDYLQGSCLIARRSAIDSVGGLDEDYFMYFEETDLCYRFREHGWRTLYLPSASVIHFGGSGTSHYTKERLRQFHRSYLLFLRKHRSALTRIVFRALLMMRSAIRSLVFIVVGLFNRKRREEFVDRAEGYLNVTLMMLKGA